MVLAAIESLRGCGRYYGEVGAGIDLVHETDAVSSAFLVLDDAQAVDPEVSRSRGPHKVNGIPDDHRHPFQDVAPQSTRAAEVVEVVFL